jgi:hypothetical protein
MPDTPWNPSTIGPEDSLIGALAVERAPNWLSPLDDVYKGRKDLGNNNESDLSKSKSRLFLVQRLASNGPVDA